MALKGTFRLLADLYNLFGDGGQPPRNENFRDLIASVSRPDIVEQGSSTAGTSTLTLDYANVLVRADAADGDIDVELPAPANVPGELVLLKRLDDVTTTVVTMVADPYEIDGATNAAVAAQYDLLGVRSNGVGWDIVTRIEN